MCSRKLFPCESEITHKHHIKPRYMGLDNSKENLVVLSIREHVLAHYMLWKIFGNLEDFMAFNCLSGKTENLEKYRILLAVKGSREITRKRALENNPMWNPETVAKVLKTRIERYGKNGLSDKQLKSILDCLPNTIHTKEAKEKSTANRRDRYSKMTKKEKIEKHAKYGEENYHYGLRRGYYEVITPEGNKLHFNSQEEIMKELKVSQSTLVRHRNKGPINSNSIVKKSNTWNGWEFIYFKTWKNK